MNKQKEPKLRFPGFTGEWVEKRLGDVVASIGSGKTKPNGIGSYPVYGSMGIIGQSENHTHEGEFLLIARVGANAGSLNYVNDRFCVTDNTLILDVSKKDTIISFMYAALQNSNLSKLVFGSGQPLVTAGQLKSLMLYLPAHPEQNKIAEFLSDIDTKIEKLTNKKELTEQYKKGAMQKIFSQKIRFKDENGKNYPDWQENRIGDVFEHRSERGDESFELLSVTMNEGVKRRTDIEGKDNSNPDKSNYKIVFNNDIVYNSMRMWQGASGVSPYDGIVSPAYTVLKPKENTISTYFGYFFKYKPVIQTFQNNSQGLTSDTWNLKYPQLSKIKFKIPCPKAQKKISDFLVDLDTRIEHIDKELVMLKEFKKGLLQGMFV